MEYKVVTIKTLKTDNNKSFKVGEDIAFSIKNQKDNYLDHYIGNIKEIFNDSIIINNVEINRTKINSDLRISLKDIVNNSCNYVYCD